MKKRIEKPTFVEVMLAFRPADDLLAQLRTGLVDCLKTGEAVMVDKVDNDLYILAPAIRGWIDAMERITRCHRVLIDFGPMQRLAAKLDAGMMLTLAHINECQTIVNKCRAAYKNMDIYTVKSLINTQLIALEAESLGLCNQKRKQ